MKHFINNSDDNAINIHKIQYLFTYKAHSVMLWFEFNFGAKFLELVQFLFSFVM